MSSRNAVARRTSSGADREITRSGRPLAVGTADRDDDLPVSRGRLSAVEPHPADDGEPDRRAPLEATGRLLSVEDVSRYLGVSERWVYEQVRTGTLPAMYIARSWRLRQEVVDAFADSFHWQPRGSE